MLNNKIIAVQEIPSVADEQNPIIAMTESNPILVVNVNNTINYLNKFAQTLFRLNNNSHISEIQTDINLPELLSNFFKSNFPSLSLILRIKNLSDLSFKEYNAEVEKIELDGTRYLFVVFHQTEKEVILEDRINSMYTAIEYANLPIMIIDGSGKISFLSRSMEKILGFTIDEMYKNFFCLPLEHLLSKADLLIAERAFFLKQSWVKIISFKEDGKIIFREFQLTPFSNTDAVSNAFMLVVHDITDYIQKNILVKESENKLRSIINNIRDPLFILKQSKGKLIFETGNNGFFRTFDLDKSKLADSDLRIVFSSDLLKLLLKKVENLLQDVFPFVEFKTQYNLIHYQCKLSLMDISNDDEAYIMIILHNISDQENYQDKMKAAFEKEVQLSRLKSTFIQSMSHEIRTPFNAISGYADILDESIKANDYKNTAELVVLVKEVLNKVSHLFTRIIDLSEIESSEMILDYVHLNYNQILTSVYNKLFAEAKKKGLEFNLELTDQDASIKIDWVKFEKIIYEITDNAIKYTVQGKVIIRSFILDQLVHITITDTGEGMNQDEIKFLLEPFSQEEQGYTRKYQGVGLGLAIASKLTKLMGGLFEIVSRKQTGTKVILIFPVAKN